MNYDNTVRKSKLKKVFLLKIIKPDIKKKNLS